MSTSFLASVTKSTTEDLDALANEQGNVVFSSVSFNKLIHSVGIMFRLFELQSVAGRRRSVFKIDILVSWGLTWWNP